MDPQFLIQGQISDSVLRDIEDLTAVRLKPQYYALYETDPALLVLMI